MALMMGAMERELISIASDDEDDRALALASEGGSTRAPRIVQIDSDTESDGPPIPARRSNTPITISSSPPRHSEPYGGLLGANRHIGWQGHPSPEALQTTMLPHPELGYESPVLELLDHTMIVPQSPVVEPYILFQRKMKDLFADICPNFLEILFQRHSVMQPGENIPAYLEQTLQTAVTEVLENIDYPKDPDASLSKKRKRGGDEYSEASKEEQYSSKERPSLPGYQLGRLQTVLAKEFPTIHNASIENCLKRRGNLYTAYLEIHGASENGEEDGQFRRLKRPRSSKSDKALDDPQLEEELKCARRTVERTKDLKRQKELDAAAVAKLEQRAIEEGNVVECQCCFTDTPTFQSTHCSNDPCHFFCLECAKSAAKAQIELQRFKLQCMDCSGCKMDFSPSEQSRFLDSDQLSMIERLQRQEELRIANIEGLEQCPRCDYAEIYPPVAENREFECKNDSCDAMLICRLCKKDSHLPKSCEEYQRDLGMSERNKVAEAMSEALIRKCPKCSVAIIKEEGCNKMTCPKCNCHFCDVCKKDITTETYRHFKPNGPCQQIDDHVTRDQKRIREAAQEAKAKLLRGRSDINEDDLEIRFSAAASETGRGAKARPQRHHRVRQLHQNQARRRARQFMMPNIHVETPLPPTHPPTRPSPPPPPTNPQPILNGLTHVFQGTGNLPFDHYQNVELPQNGLLHQPNLDRYDGYVEPAPRPQYEQFGGLPVNGYLESQPHGLPIHRDPFLFPRDFVDDQPLGPLLTRNPFPFARELFGPGPAPPSLAEAMVTPPGPFTWDVNQHHFGINHYPEARNEQFFVPPIEFPRPNANQFYQDHTNPGYFI